MSPQRPPCPRLLPGGAAPRTGPDRVACRRPGPGALRTPGRFAGLGALLLLLMPAAAGAQSLLAGGGLGVAVDPLDARARALGSVGVGSSGWHLLPTDPAAAAGLGLATVTASFQPVRATLTDGRSAGHARFPTIGVSYPLWGNVFSITLGSALDQRWETVTPRLIDVSGTEVPAVDVYRSNGSVGRVQAGWARRVLPTLAVGATVGTWVGSVERTFTRALDSGTVGNGVEVFAVQGRWRATGLVAAAGVAWDPLEMLRVSAAATWTDGLEFTPSLDGSPQGATYSLPLELRVGGTATLAPGLAVTAGVTHADWSTVGEELGAGAGVRGAAWSYGGGLEWSRGSILGRALPLRVGARHQDLPFLYEGAEASERVLSAGAGWSLVAVEGEVEPRARIDLSLERGTRSAGALSERFLRTTVTLRVSGG